MKTKIRKLKVKRQALEKQAKTIIDRAEKSGRDITDTENEQINSLADQIESLGGEISVLEQYLSVQPGFKNYGQYLQAVYQASGPGGNIDHRLISAGPVTYGNESTGADSAYVVPPDFSKEIFQISLGGTALLPLTDNTEIKGNSMAFPGDETTPWGSEGVVAYWEDEADEAVQTKPSLTPSVLRMKKLIALVPVTDELLADAVALSQYLTRRTARAIRWKVNDGIVNGNGVGRMKGVSTHPALIVQAAEGGQSADTIQAANVAKMYARMPEDSIESAVWLFNNTAFPQLMTMSVGNSPIWTPPQSRQDPPAGRLIGRPLYLSQSCQQLGDQGDSYFLDLQSYRTITKAGGIETATSMHMWFDRDMSAFRAVFRIDGQPSVSQTITGNQGDTLSPFITLAARA
ncbi:MAG: phage major capsid protein [Gammaproteobacteria bacterium]|nr:phage major capsid protein [Gammaproteobacteria bacterium]MDH5799993.1 phage major capsid protein [Gammaproteobacteria bacterium]